VTNYPGDVDLVDDSHHLDSVDDDLREVDPIQDLVDNDGDEDIKQGRCLSHALPTGTPRHLGDLGNITISPDGKGTLDIVAPGANLKEGDPNSFLGRAIIVHEKQDDGAQPTGNAGGRIGCAEIK